MFKFQVMRLETLWTPGGKRGQKCFTRVSWTARVYKNLLLVNQDNVPPARNLTRLDGEEEGLGFILVVLSRLGKPLYIWMKIIYRSWSTCKRDRWTWQIHSAIFAKICKKRINGLKYSSFQFSQGTCFRDSEGELLEHETQSEENIYSFHQESFFSFPKKYLLERVFFYRIKLSTIWWNV